SGCLSDFGHSSPLSPNGFPCLDAVDPANSRMPPVSASPFQDGTVFSAPQYDFLLLSTAHNQTAWSRIVLPAPTESFHKTKNFNSYGFFYKAYNHILLHFIRKTFSLKKTRRDIFSSNPLYFITEYFLLLFSSWSRGFFRLNRTF